MRNQESAEKRVRKKLRVLKELASKWAPRTDAINDENGVILKEDEDIKHR